MPPQSCVEVAETIQGWLLLLIVVPSVINIISAVLLIISIYLTRRLRAISEEISASTHWLMRTAVRAGIGPKAKRALTEYARTKPSLSHLVQLPEDKKNE